MRAWAGVLFAISVVVITNTPAEAHQPPAQAVAPPVSLPVREGARGDEVKKVQARLKELGYYAGRVDGLYGPITTAAVRRFQLARQLPGVGFVGPRTHRALFASSPAGAPASQAAATPGKQPAQVTAKAAGPPPGGRAPAPRLPLPDPEPGTYGVGGGRLALTFDDGPDATVLPSILASLERSGAKATFFVEGSKAASHADLLRRMAGAGHEIENHSFSHRPLPGRPRAEVQKEILDTVAIVSRATGRGTRFLRPPGGALDESAVAAARAAGHRVVLWTNVGAPDVPFPGRQRLVEDILAAAYDGAVIMLHGDRPETAAALPELLDALNRKGYRLVRLDELVGG